MEVGKNANQVWIVRDRTKYNLDGEKKSYHVKNFSNPPSDRQKKIFNWKVQMMCADDLSVNKATI